MRETPERGVDWRGEVRARLRVRSRERVDPASEADVVEELAQHLEDQYAELVGRGMDSSTARAQLLAQLDDPATAVDLLNAARARESHSRSPIGAGFHQRPGLRGFSASVGGDLRYGWRALRRTPAFTAVVVLSLAIVIGANTAIFGLLDAVLLRRLPISHAEELVALHLVNEHRAATIPYGVYRTFAGLPGMPPIESYRIDAATVTAGADQTDLWIELVSGGYFDMLRATPLLGRTLSKSDASTVAQVAVVSEDYWKQHLGGRRDVIGTTVTINEAPYTIVGVMPRSYHDLFFAHPFVLAVPLATAAALGDDVSQYYTALVARLPRGAENGAMRDLLSAAYRRCCVQPPSPTSSLAMPRSRPLPDDGPIADGHWTDTVDATPHVQLADISRGITWSEDFRGQYRRVLIALMSGVAVLLLIACANVGTLLLARAAAREREFAVRLSLGASRRRMLRQLLTETLELTVAGTALGVVLASLATTMLLHELPARAIQLADVIAWRASPVILLFTVATMFGCALLAGVWPARRASRVDILGALTGADRARRARGARIEHGLVWVQVALALILATIAALFVATLRNLEHGDGGFHTRQALLARINLRYAAGADRAALAHAALSAALRVPGVNDAALSYALPALDRSMMLMPEEVPGYVPAAGERPPEFNAVSARFFTVTGIGIAAGRDFDAHDLATSEPVAIVSQSFARRYFAGRNPVGASMILALQHRQQLRIVGVARDASYGDLHDAVTTMWYMPFDQAAVHLHQDFLALTMRTDLDPVSLATSVRRAIDGAVPGVQIHRIASVGQLLDEALARERFAAALATLFGVVALGLAALGVYGVVSYSVERRTPEIGIRMALGAAPVDALWIVMRQTLGIAAIGLALGTPLALLAGRAIASQLYGVGATDARVLLGAAFALALAAIVAGFIPGRRAARVDPVVALRAD